MKRKLAFASLLVLAACGPSREALTALDHMRITQNAQQPGIAYGALSGSGNDVTLSNVQVLGPSPALIVPTDADAPPSAQPEAQPRGPVPLMRADKLTFKGLTMKDGKPLARDIVLSGVTPADAPEGATVTLGSLGIEGMNEVTGAFLAAQIARDETAAMPPFEQWRFARAGFGGLKVAAAIPQDEGETGNIDVAFDEVALLDFSGVKLGQLRLSGLKGTLEVPSAMPIAGDFDFGTFEATTINTKLMADVFGAAFEAAANPDEPADYSEFYRDFTSPLESYVDRIDWTGMRANVSGLNFTTSPLQAYVTRNAEGVAIAADSPRFTAKMTADASGGALGAAGLMMLAMGGYDSNEIELFAGGSATFDPAKDLTRWNGYHVGVADFFDVKMSGGVIGLKQAMPNLMQAFDSVMRASLDTVENEEVFEDDEQATPPVAPEYKPGGGADDDAAPADEGASEDDSEDTPLAEQDQGASNPFASDPATLMALMMGIMPLQITDLDIEITDRKLVNLIMDNQALSAGLTSEQFRADVVNMVAASSTFMSDAGVDPAIAQEMSTAVSSFLAGPGTLRVQLKPKTPLGVMSAMAMPMTKDSLGFSASFTPAPQAAPAVN